MRRCSRALLPALAVAAVLILAACAPATGGYSPPPPEAPATISGDGHYDLTVLNNATPPPVIDDTWAASYALTRTGDVYSGTLDSTDDAQDRHVEVTVAGTTITSVYTRELTKPAGEGIELTTDAVTAATVTDAAECPGADALELTIYGPYTLNGAPWTLSVAPVVWTICDPAAAAYFG